MSTSSTFRFESQSWDGHGVSAGSAQYDLDVITSTLFWRNPPQLRAIACKIMPALRNNVDRPIRIAVHGGSIGCEAWSIAIALHRFGQSYNVTIDSFDISEKAIVQANQGIYQTKHLLDPGPMQRSRLPYRLQRLLKRHAQRRVAVPWWIRQRYLAAQNDQTVRVKTKSLPRVNFSVCDASSLEDVLQHGQYDLVLFQNALVHLSPSLGQQVVSNLIGSLSDYGLLLLGGTHPDLLSEVTKLHSLASVDWDIRDVYEAWSGRTNLWQSEPNHHLGLEPMNAERDDWAWRYGYCFAPVKSARFWVKQTPVYTWSNQPPIESITTKDHRRVA